MRYSLTMLTLLVALRVSAQLTVGASGMTILSGTPLAVDGLTLTPSSVLTIANNSIQESNTPLAGKPSINRVYQFGAPLLFSGTAGIHYLPSELNGYTESALQLAYAPTLNTSLTVTSGSSIDAMTHYVSNSLTNQNLFVVTAGALSDLTLLVQARPSSVYGTTPITMIVNVVEINGAATTAPITVKIPKDPKLTLNFNPALTTLNGHLVQNNAWSFSGPSGGLYTLTTPNVIAAGEVLSFGLTGSLAPRSTTGVLTASSILMGGSGGEVRLDNNNDADKIDYFQQ